MFSCVSKYWQTNITKREHKFVRVQHLFFRIFPLMFRQSSLMNICIHLQSQTLSDICLYQSCFKRQGRIKVCEYGIRKLKIENIICWVMLPNVCISNCSVVWKSFFVWICFLLNRFVRSPTKISQFHCHLHCKQAQVHNKLQKI